MKVFFSSLGMVLFAPLLFATDSTTVITAKLDDIAIYPQRSAPATVISMNETTVSSRIEAQVGAIPVKVGDIVEKGSVLAQLDCTDYQLRSNEIRTRLESLEAQIKLAESRLDRTRKLTLKQSVSEELLDERESDLFVLEASLRGTKIQLDIALIDESRCQVVSPFRALVQERESAEGQFASIGTPLVSIIDIGNLEISAQIQNSDATQVESAELLFFEQSKQRIPVRLRSIVPAINPDTRNREVRLVFDNEQALPGTAGKLVWKDRRPHIPGEYLVRRGDSLGVFTIENNVAIFIPVSDAQAGRASPTALNIDTNIVIDGHYSLKENDSVVTQN